MLHKTPWLTVKLNICMHILFDVKDVDKACYFNVFTVHVGHIIVAIIGLSINKQSCIQEGFFF